MMTKKQVLQALVEAGWEQYMGKDDYRYWRLSGSNRYVDIESPYVDIYAYADEEKWGTYLTIKEMDLFTNLAFILTQEAEEE